MRHSGRMGKAESILEPDASSKVNLFAGFVKKIVNDLKANENSGKAPPTLLA
jgi:hypothetical protein